MKDLKKNNLVNVSHELKAPVANLILFLETLYEYDKTLSDYCKQEIIELAICETQRLRNLIDQFLYFRENTDKEEKHFPDMMKEREQSYYILAIYKDFFLTSGYYGYSEQCMIHVDSKLYIHIILSLLENASKFTRQDGKGWIVSETDIFGSINLSSFIKSKYGRSSVIDNGIGLSENLLIFIKSNDEFYSIKRDSLGLRIIKDLLITHNLFLNVVSYPSRGAKLFFTINLIKKR